uniref:Uncharacterized protein n=1 Tax=Candidatus Kentrum sp. FM TaxID=2126340 RepID=A0A450X3Z2_9GAMM|nr:MAG: hypothetical protein BECKFM1743C_GA0114222_102271 [Candidatus Kentron sp. FM]VFJ75885.1 MAG: hypothetical protein BECKFM1743A_GA0114220_108842 [Candidatus Kentron sp. FM]VFK24007.1 MAG: hypothetical protein BECKFM1743B_GA0114221_109631 [Candidatus Kentron sp. FM]
MKKSSAYYAPRIASGGVRRVEVRHVSGCHVAIYTPGFRILPGLVCHVREPLSRTPTLL